MRILLLGGMGVFGRRVARFLRETPGCTVLSSQRRPPAPGQHDIIRLDTADPTWPVLLKTHRIDLVINLAGPFQGQGYDIPAACIQAGCHYIDLADGRDYVTGFGPALDGLAQAHQVIALTGASTVPCIAASMIDDLAARYFREITALDYGVTPGNRTERGVATVAAILSYVGMPLTTRKNGMMQTIYGWQGLHRRRYPILGKRWFSYCDIPDLDLFPVRYPDLRDIRFVAGLELPILHLGLWGLSWLRRGRCLPPLERGAKWLRAASLWFWPFGSDAGGMHIILRGTGLDGTPRSLGWYLIAQQGDGPFVPATPAIMLARLLASGATLPIGAGPALGLLRPDDLRQIWQHLHITEHLYDTDL